MPTDTETSTILPEAGALPVYSATCRRCARLAAFLDEVRSDHPAYFCRPVPPFGDADARLAIVGLAPGLHGANATGRPFTGDHAGILLYATLHAYGYASQPQGAAAGDGLVLRGCRITNAVKCLPPDNKPVGAEINTCNTFLANELATLPAGSIVLALGGIAHRAIVKAVGARQADYKFAHATLHDLPDFQVLDSYHCSRYNTNTGRLTEAMFDAIFAQARELLDK
jgi:uracil-DNA glycosylase family 4